MLFRTTPVSTSPSFSLVMVTLSEVESIVLPYHYSHTQDPSAAALNLWHHQTPNILPPAAVRHGRFPAWQFRQKLRLQGLPPCTVPQSLQTDVFSWLILPVLSCARRRSLLCIAASFADCFTAFLALSVMMLFLFCQYVLVYTSYYPSTPSPPQQQHNAALIFSKNFVFLCFFRCRGGGISRFDAADRGNHRCTGSRW